MPVPILAKLRLGSACHPISVRVSGRAKEELQWPEDCFLEMSTPGPTEITLLLKAWCAGDANALNRLTPLVYNELRRMARRYMRHERAGNTLQTTALINEAYLRLVDA